MTSKLKTLIESATQGKWDQHSGMVRSVLEQSAVYGNLKITTSRYPVAECFHLGPEHPVKPETAEANAELICHLVNKASQIDALVEFIKEVSEYSCTEYAAREQLIIAVRQAKKLIADYQKEEAWQR